MGVPREPIRIEKLTDSLGLIAIHTRTDHTRAMEQFSQRRVRELEDLHLSGYVFKKNSPSCGIGHVRVYHAHGMPSRNGIGLFARTFIQHFPLIPVEEEGRLHEPSIRDNFIERIFCYRQWQDLRSGGTTHAGPD